MKLNTKKNNITGDLGLEGIDAKITTEQLSKMWDMFSNPYKDNISSIVREITSNCVDSHIEAKVNDAVVITIDQDVSGKYIKFSDVGVGLSPDRIKNVYMNYLNSTKDTSNEMYGAFGIGSKSPLSYSDVFYIDTVYEGVHYSYMMRKGDEAPRIEKLNEVAIDKRNGTDIKIYINSDDVISFVNAIEIQLKYFKDVYLDYKLNDAALYSNKINGINNFKIYEYKTFKVRVNDNQISSKSKPLELAIGDVTYPIDWKIVYPDLSNFLKIPVAIKLNIGEVDVNYNREDIKYNDKTIKCIRKKVNEVIDEILDILEEKDKKKNSIEFNNVVDYIKYVNLLISTNYYNYLYKSTTVIDDYWNILIKDNNRTYGLQLYDFFEDIFKIRNHNTHYNIASDITSELKKNNKNYIFNLNIDDINYNRKIKFYYPTLNNVKPSEISPFDYLTNNLHSFNTMYKKEYNSNSHWYKIKNYNLRTHNSIISDSLRNDNKSNSIYYLYVLNDVKNMRLKQNIKFYIDKLKEDIISKTNRHVKIYIVERQRNLRFYKATLNLSSVPKDQWRGKIKYIQDKFEKPFDDTLMIRLSDIENKADKKFVEDWKVKKGLNSVKKAINNTSDITYKNISFKYDYQRDNIHQYIFESYLSDTKSDDLMASEYHILHTKDIVPADKKFVFVNSDQLKKTYITMKYLSIADKLFDLKMFENTKFVKVSKQNYNKLIKIKKMYSINDFIKDNREKFEDLYLYVNLFDEKDQHSKNISHIMNTLVWNNKRDRFIFLNKLCNNNSYQEYDKTLTEIKLLSYSGIQVKELMKKMNIDLPLFLETLPKDIKSKSKVKMKEINDKIDKINSNYSDLFASCNLFGGIIPIHRMGTFDSIKSIEKTYNSTDYKEYYPELLNIHYKFKQLEDKGFIDKNGIMYRVNKYLIENNKNIYTDIENSKFESSTKTRFVDDLLTILKEKEFKDIFKSHGDINNLASDIKFNFVVDKVKMQNYVNSNYLHKVDVTLSDYFMYHYYDMRFMLNK